MKTHANQMNHPKSTFFEDVSYKYFPYWPLFLCLTLLFIAGGIVYLRYTAPVYEATATLMVKDEKKGADENNIGETLNIVSSKKIVENELVVIQSGNLVEKVVQDLHLYAPIYEKGKVSDRSAYTSSPIIIRAVNPSLIKGAEDVKFTYHAGNNTVRIDNQNYPLNKPVKTSYGALIFSANPKMTTPTDRDLFFSLIPVDVVTNQLSKKIEVIAAGKLSSIVQLSLKDEVPQRAEDILNTLIENYNKASLDYKNDLAKNTVAFVDDRLHVVEQELNAVEKKIQKYKSNNNIVDLSEQSRLYLQNVGNNDQQLAQINMQVAVLDQVENYVSSKKADGMIAPSTLGFNDPNLNQMLAKLQENEMEYEKLKKTTAENHPILTSLRSQIERLRPGILDNIRSQKKGLVASRNNLSGTNRSYNSMLQTVPQKERELIDVSRQQSIKNGIYSFLLQKREESALAFASNLPDSKVVQSAKAGIKPVSPNKGIVFMGAFALAFLFGIGFVQLKEAASNKIIFRSEIEQHTEVPIVAEISNIEDVKGMAVKGSAGIIEEQFRQLRAATGLLNKKTRRKVLVTSSIPGEGKSFVSRNLAINLSLSGKKVVLLDLDLRNPQTSKSFSMKEGVGVGEFLESEMEPYEIIKSTEYNHLHVIPAGNAQSNPTELILSEKMKQLFTYLEDAFEYIIVDTSPVNPLADAYVLAEYADLTLYVVRHQYTPKTCIKRLDDTNRIKKLKNMAIVFNDVKARGFMNRTYGFGYGYGYEYGYAYQKENRSWSKSLFNALSGSKKNNNTKTPSKLKKEST